MDRDDARMDTDVRELLKKEAEASGSRARILTEQDSTVAPMLSAEELKAALKEEIVPVEIPWLEGQRRQVHVRKIDPAEIYTQWGILYLEKNPGATIQTSLDIQESIEIQRFFVTRCLVEPVFVFKADNIANNATPVEDLPQTLLSALYDACMVVSDPEAAAAFFRSDATPSGNGTREDTPPTDS